MMQKTQFILGLSMVTGFAILNTASALAADDLTYSGHIDLYYLYDFGRSDVANDLVGRAFDVKNNSFSLAVAQLNIAKAPTKEIPYGFTANIVIGRTADLNVAGRNANETAYKNFQQLYGTYVGNSGVTVDFGKFTTWIGYESLVSPDNANFGLSGQFNYAQPFWHMGLRATKTFSDKFTGALYVVNGWNEVEDTNDSKTVGISTSYILNQKTTVAFNYIGGNEGAQTPGSNQVLAQGLPSGAGFLGLGITNVQLADIVIVHNLTPKIKLAFNGDYASAVGGNATSPSGKWTAYGFYGSWAVNTADTLALRFDALKDADGLRFFGAGGGSLSAVTATWNKATSKNSLVRFELRRDFASSEVFASDSGPKSNRTTFTVANTIKF